MRIYTKTGDDGKTNLIGDRRSKDDVRVEAYGTLDELNSFLQLALAKIPENLQRKREEFTEISHLIFDCASDLAIAKPGREYKLTDDSAAWLEKLIDEYKEQVEKLQYFILPGGCELSSLAHVCRTITRRAERRIVTLKNKEEINDSVLIFINRLSDYFFIAARVINHELGYSDAQYKRSKKAFRG
jgi:cob(I)alamin adenosyltransferase